MEQEQEDFQLFEIVVSYLEKTFKMVPYFPADDEADAKGKVLEWLARQGIDTSTVEIVSMEPVERNSSVTFH